MDVAADTDLNRSVDEKMDVDVDTYLNRSVDEKMDVAVDTDLNRSVDEKMDGNVDVNLNRSSLNQIKKNYVLSKIYNNVPVENKTADFANVVKEQQELAIKVEEMWQVFLSKDRV